MDCYVNVYRIGSLWGVVLCWLATFAPLHIWKIVVCVDAWFIGMMHLKCLVYMVICFCYKLHCCL